MAIATVSPAAPGFAVADWLILGVYLTAIVVIGLLVARRGDDGDGYFLAGRRMPMWAVAVSVLATSLSAATFIGGPQQAYAADLTYLSANLGGLLAVIVVAVLFVPAYYRHRVTSIYELLGHELGDPARMAASGVFMLGRVFASGARLFMVALPFALIAFGSTEPTALVVSIVLIATGAAAYTMAGGIRAVIWTDVVQAVLLVGTVLIAFVLLLGRIPLPIPELARVLADDAGGSKLRLLDTSLDPGRSYTVWTALIGFTLFNVAAFGTDQDLTQRMLTCRSARSGAWAAILSNLLGWPVVFLFLCIGLLLYVFYGRPDVMGAAAPQVAVADDRAVFLQFMLTEVPVGLRGLMMSGLFAAAMSSMDSALNAMTSTTIADFYRPWRHRRVGPSTQGNHHERVVSRRATAVWAIALAGFAIGCVYWQQASGDTLITFALRIMVFAYGGLLGVFLTTLLTARGNATTAVAALVIGYLAVVAMEDVCWQAWAPLLGLEITLAFPWKMVVATALSFGVCCLGKRRPVSPP